jgi:hypothetical protein
VRERKGRRSRRAHEKGALRLSKGAKKGQRLRLSRGAEKGQRWRWIGKLLDRRRKLVNIPQRCR